PYAEPLPARLPRQGWRIREASELTASQPPFLRASPGHYSLRRGQPVPPIPVNFYGILGIPSGNAPAGRARELLEKIDVVGALRRAAHASIDLMRVLADEDTPAVGLDAVEDDLGRFRRTGRRLLGKSPLALGDDVADVVVGHRRDVAAHRGEPRPRLRELLLGHRVGLTAALDLARVQWDRRADMAGHDDRAFDVRGVDAQIGDQRLGEALDREFCRAVGGVRDLRPDRSPEAIDAARVDNVAFLGLLQHRQKCAGAVVDTAPADVEGALPFLAAMRKHAAAAADPGIVEQEMDLVGVVMPPDVVAEPRDLRLVRYIGEICRDPQPLRHAGGLAEPLRLGHPLR